MFWFNNNVFLELQNMRLNTDCSKELLLGDSIKKFCVSTLNTVATKIFTAPVEITCFKQSDEEFEANSFEDFLSRVSVTFF